MLSGETSAAEAGTENEAFIAAVNRCATQKQKPVNLHHPNSLRSGELV
jgi:hypothetical protein